MVYGDRGRATLTDRPRLPLFWAKNARPMKNLSIKYFVSPTYSRIERLSCIQPTFFLNLSTFLIEELDKYVCTVLVELYETLKESWEFCKNAAIQVQIYTKMLQKIVRTSSAVEFWCVHPRRTGTLVQALVCARLTRTRMALRTTASALWSRFVPAAKQALPAGSSSFFRQVRACDIPGTGLMTKKANYGFVSCSQICSHLRGTED